MNKLKHRSVSIMLQQQKGFCENVIWNYARLK